MLANEQSAASAAPKENEIREFVVGPPRSMQFAGTQWREDLSVYLGRMFPDLQVGVTANPALRDFEEVVVMPVVGCAGDETTESLLKPITIRTRNIMDEIAMAVRTYRVGEASRLN